MGQQQLLLLTIGILVVAVAFITGIQSWQQYQRQAAADRLVDRGLTIASTAVAWKTRNDPFSGGNQSYLGLSVNGMARLVMDADAAGGRFEISDVTDDSLVVSGVSLLYPEIGVRTTVVEYTIVSTEVNYNGQITLSDAD